MRYVWTLVLSLVFMASPVDAKDLWKSSYGATALEVEVLEWDETFAKVEPIQINLDAVMRRGAPYALSESNSAETIEFPVDGVTYTATKLFSKVKANGTLQWYGKVEGSNLVTHMSVVGDAIAAEIWLDLLSHRSIMFRGEGHFLVERDFRKESERLIDDVLDPVLAAKLIPPQGTTISAEYVGFGKRRAVRHPSTPSACSGEVVYNTTYLAAYNDSALAKLGGSAASRTVAMQVRTENDEAAINSALINTRGDLKYQVTLVATVHIEYTEAAASGKTLSNDLNALPHLDELKELRDRHGADNVMVFVGQTLGSAGMAIPPGVGLVEEEGYSVMGALCSALVAMHEWGHQAYRMGHHPEDWAGADPTWAVDHYVDGVFYGVMAMSIRSELVPHGGEVYPGYALSTTYFKGVATGVRDQRENGRMIELLTPYTSNLRVSGNEIQCVQSGALTLSAHIETKSNISTEL